MVSVAEIRDGESLKAWRKGRPWGDSVLVASRTAARTAPFAWARPATGRDADDLTALTICRALLTCWVETRSSPGRVTGISAVYSEADTVRADVLEAVLAASRADGETVALAETALANVLEQARADIEYDRRAARADPLASSVADHRADSIAARAEADLSAVAGSFWEQVREDARSIEVGDNLLLRDLWSAPAPERFRRADEAFRARWETDPAFDFWLRWWGGVLSGQQVDWALQEKVALIPRDVWNQGAAAVAAEIAKIEEEQRSPLASAALFDFIEANRRMRMVGFESDLANIRSPEAANRFGTNAAELRNDLADWCEYASEMRGRSNLPAVVIRVVEKVVVEFDHATATGEVRARRLVTLGSDLRRLSVDEAYREELGETLAAMLDERVDQFGALIGAYLSPTFAKLRPLQELELGDLDPSELNDLLRAAVRRMREMPNEELRNLEPEGHAVFEEMIRELEELDAAILEARSPKMVAVLKRRFAAKYGGVSATLGRYVEKAKNSATRPLENLDELVKWFKRWETLDAIRNWLLSWLS